MSSRALGFILAQLYEDSEIGVDISSAVSWMFPHITVPVSTEGCMAIISATG